MNDISFASKYSNLILFADDTNIFFSDNDLSTLQDTVCKELSVLSKWFAANKLSLNASKTNYIVFNSCNRNYAFDIRVDGQVIKQASHVKFLGVYIDSNLSWENHISHVCNQVSKGVGILCRLKHILPRLILRQIYLTLILPHLSYCCIV